MIVYHGTARGRAARIWRHGFLPLRPSRRVWFAEDKEYAVGRAKCQSKRGRDEPEVMACQISLGEMRQRLGSPNVIHKGRVIAIDAPVGVAAVRPGSGADEMSMRDEIAEWVNRILALVPGHGVWAGHRGIEPLARELAERMRRYPPQPFSPLELFDLARRHLPAFFKSYRFVPDRIVGEAYPGNPDFVEKEEAGEEVDAAETGAIDLLDSAKAEDREKGLGLLRELGDPDLFDWCVMFLGDPDPKVKVAAARTMLHCRYVVPEVIMPLTDSSDKLLRGAAIAVLAKYAGKERPQWFELGLKDPADHVRVMTAAQLRLLDPKKHRRIIRVALHDPNPDVAKRARKAAKIPARMRERP